MKVLIIRFSSIGDIVLTTPVIRCVKQQVHDVEVHYLTKPAYLSVLSSNPYISKIHLLNGDWQMMINELKKEQFDYIVDLHHNLRSQRVKSSLKPVKSYSLHKLNKEKWLLTAFKINVLPHQHIVDRYMQTVEPLGAVNDGKGLDYFIPREDEVSPDRLPLSHCAGFIAMVIGATYATKKLPVKKLQELCRLIDYPIILLGGKEDAAAGEEIAKTNDIKIYNACGKYRLNESADLVRKSKFVISHDTGLMHVAAAFQKPVISVWGNTVPAFGMTPYYAAGDTNILNATTGSNNINSKSLISEVKNLYCRPCSKIGYRKCPLGHFKCMKKQDIKAISRAAISLLYLYA